MIFCPPHANGRMPETEVTMAVQYARKEDLNYAAQVQKRLFVQKEEGKSLIADTDVTKLSGIEDGAQANVIEAVKVNGTAVEVTDKAVDIDIDSMISSAISGVYTPKGSCAFADLPTSGNKEGDVYNVTDAFTTTDAFEEGAGGSYPAGTNVVWTSDGKWDCLAGIYDLSGYLKKEEIEEITEEEIEAMYADTDATA